MKPLTKREQRLLLEMQEFAIEGVEFMKGQMKWNPNHSKQDFNKMDLYKMHIRDLVSKILKRYT